MRLIDADTKITVLMHDEEWYKEEMTVDDLISKFADETPPTIDAAPVIRCKDCVFWKYYCRVVDGVRTDHVCSKKRELDGLMYRTQADDFCSWAERKEE